jgi:hypothetical protein
MQRKVRVRAGSWHSVPRLEGGTRHYIREEHPSRQKHISPMNSARFIQEAETYSCGYQIAISRW